MRCIEQIIAVTLVMGLSATWAKADVVIVVSSKSPISSLSQSQLAEIFLGKTNYLPNGAQVVPLDQEEGVRIRDEFYEKLVGKSPAQVKTYWSKVIFTGRGVPPRTVRDDKEMKKRIAESPTAIGYIDKALLDSSVKVVF